MKKNHKLEYEIAISIEEWIGNWHYLASFTVFQNAMGSLLYVHFMWNNFSKVKP